MLNILYLYNATQTYTNTVFEHIAAFSKYSRHRTFFCHQDPNSELQLDLARFDVVVIHFSIRLPYDQLSPSTASTLTRFKGLKVLFIQDEYDHTHRAWYWINALGLQLVFSVVPQPGMDRVYPPGNFPNTRFVGNLTGYVPDDLRLKPDTIAPSNRSLIVGYRGRPLPIRYGRLGIEKVEIGKMVKAYCDAHGVETDIAWTEGTRIYGGQWYQFMVSCRSMLGSESGSNVFDWDGTLVERIAQFRKQNPKADDDLVYANFVRSEEIDGIMNQVSPRVFEAIAAKTVLVLFEGDYSSVVQAGEHFIPVRKDGSNLGEVVALLHDGDYVNAMAERAYRDVIASGKYSYRTFAGMVDDEIEHSAGKLELQSAAGSVQEVVERGYETHSSITTAPIRARPPRPSTDTLVHTVAGARGSMDLGWRFASYLWWKLPESARRFLKPRLKKMLGRG